MVAPVFPRPTVTSTLGVSGLQREAGLLENRYPHIDWKGAMGFRDVIAHQYFDLDVEQVLVICDQSLPSLILAVEDLLKN